MRRQTGGGASLSDDPLKVETSCEEEEYFLDKVNSTIRPIRNLVHDPTCSDTYAILCLDSVKTLMRNSPSSPALNVVGTMQYVPGSSLKRLVTSGRSM